MARGQSASVCTASPGVGGAEGSPFGLGSTPSAATPLIFASSLKTEGEGFAPRVPVEMQYIFQLIVNLDPKKIILETLLPPFFQ